MRGSCKSSILSTYACVSIERGAGETLACGSGACAAVVAGRLWDQLAARVKVALRGGDLVVSWAGRGYPVYMTGPATHVFRGRIDI